MEKPVNCSICRETLDQEFNICVEVPLGPIYHRECLLNCVERKQAGQREVTPLLRQLEARVQKAEEKAAKADAKLQNMEKRVDQLESAFTAAAKAKSEQQSQASCFAFVGFYQLAALLGLLGTAVVYFTKIWDFTK